MFWPNAISVGFPFTSSAIASRADSRAASVSIDDGYFQCVFALCRKR